MSIGQGHNGDQLYPIGLNHARDKAVKPSHSNDENFMDTQSKAQRIATILDELYPSPPIPLDHQSPFQLLVAVLLSAQCTDERVNKITPKLFKRAATPQEMALMERDEILEIIRSCGLGPQKSKALDILSKMLVTDHQGQVPRTFKELEALPGVGHKTASVVMAQAFGVPAFPVDTHIHRLAKRWGFVSPKASVKATEKALKAAFPEENWNKLHLQLIFFGREHCPARKHEAAACPICSWAAEAP